MLLGRMGPKYKVTYFDNLWIAEPIRMLLSYVGEDFQDVRLDWGEWEKGTNPEMKKGHPYGRLPYLEERLDNGQVIQISQSFTVCRYLARKYNLAGATLLEEIKADEYTDCVKDMLKSVEQLWGSTDKEFLATHMKYLYEKSFPGYFSCFEADLKKQGGSETVFAPLVGHSVTWADIILAHYVEIFDMFLMIDHKQPKSILENYPAIRGHQKGVFNLGRIKAWRDKRPKTHL